MATEVPCVKGVLLQRHVWRSTCVQVVMHSEPKDPHTSASLAREHGVQVQASTPGCGERIWYLTVAEKPLPTTIPPSLLYKDFCLLISKAGLKRECIFLLLVLLRRVSFIMKYNKLYLQDNTWCLKPTEHSSASENLFTSILLLHHLHPFLISAPTACRSPWLSE